MSISGRLRGRYEIRQVLGQGGMGVVYKAYDTVVKREVALKTIRDRPEQAALQLFYKECDVLASLSHPNIVEIFDIGEFEEEGVAKPYFVMPLLPGVTLDVLIRASSSRLTVERSVEIIGQVCRGLHAAHERGLVHRDLKPSNIFVMQDDSVKIIDFGLAHMVDARSSMGQKGTLLYMAPEQVEMKTPSALTDIFALGVTAYETLTRRLPWDATTAADLAEAILHHIPPPVSELNPQVNQALSRVVHKAMAKQPWHRFSTARELSETLQKGLRNEPIEMFDPSRIQPRIQRAQKAFEQSDYQFATEILSGLEAEGHIDPAMSRLRRQLDQAIRRKTVFQLLESARTRLEEQEYPLALQKVQEVLQLEPDNDDALSLRDTIESRRSQVQIDDWLRLARQHMNNCAFSHARQAVQNVLQQSARDSRALELLADLDRREQDYLRELQEKEQAYQAAQEAYHKGELSWALCRMQRVLELDRRAPDISVPDRGGAYQNFFNQVRSEHDAIEGAYAEARRRLEERNFGRARELCEEWLAKYPGQALFQALKFEVEEQERQGLSAYIADVDRHVEAEPDLERRVNILKEAVERYPDETHFSRPLRLMCEKRDLVNSIVAKARQAEARGQFTEARGQWEILGSIYRQYPGLDFEIERVTRRRDQQARQEAKANWVQQIDRQLEAGDCSRAVSLLESASKEFPNDSELAELEKLIRQAVERRNEADRLLAEGRELCEQQRYEEGIEAIRKAWLLDQSHATTRGVYLEALMDRARAVIDSDWRAAEVCVRQALELEPEHGLAKSLRTLIEDRKREAFVDQCVSRARQLQTAGDVAGALAEVEQGRAAYPYVARLSQLRATLEKALAEVQRAQARRGEPQPGQPAETAALSALGTTRAPDAVPLPAVTMAPPAAEPPAPGLPSPLAMAAAAQAASSAARPLEGPLRSPGLESSVQQTTLARPAEPVPQPVEPAAPAGAAEAATPPPPPPVVPAVGPSHPTQRAAPPVIPRPRPSLRATLAQAATRVRPAARTALRTIQQKPWVAAGAAGLAVLVLIIVLVRALGPGGSAGPSAVPVEISTSPPGATIRINQEARGVSPFQVELQPGAHQLEASLEGYQPLATTLNVAPGSHLPLSFTLQPLPCTLRLYTDLETATVWLDDQPRGEFQAGQLVLGDVAPGKHVLRVSSAPSEAVVGFEAPPGAPPILAEPITVKEFTAVMVSNLGGRGRLHSSASSANAALDGQPVGQVVAGGLALLGLSPGTHELGLGEGAAQRKLLLEAGPVPALTVFLYTDRDVGTLVVSTGQDGVRVLLDGKPQSRLTQHGQLRLAGLPVKTYGVRVVKEGYLEEPEQRVQIRKGEDARVSFKLRAAPLLVLQGALPGTQVAVDRNVLGTVGPDGSFSARVTPGPHAIELRKDQLKPRRFQRDFQPGEEARLSGGEVVLESGTGILKIDVTPAGAQVTIRSGKEAARPVSGNALMLPEGSYTLTARAPGYLERSVTVEVAGGATRNVELALSRERAKPAPRRGMADWEQPADWAQDGTAFTRTGGEFVCFRPTPTAGVFSFTAQLKRGRRLQWFLRYTDPQNYLLFQIDKKTFYRRQVAGGKSTELPRKPLGLPQGNSIAATVQIEVSPGAIVHKVRVGNDWVTLDSWQDPNGNFATGKFGFLINGKDQVTLSDFSHQAAK